MSERGRPQLVLASGNAGKLVEFRELLADLPVDFLGLDAFPGVEMPEEGTDYAANAILKAQSVAEATGQLALADDSGLEVAGLGGAPGPLSARYGGPDLDDAGRVAHLLAALERAGCAEAGDAGRAAAFVCFGAWAAPGRAAIVERGHCAGRILTARSGSGGFGYDPIFRPDGYEVSMAEVGTEIKNRISHRARAVAALLPTLRRALR